MNIKDFLYKSITANIYDLVEVTPLNKLKNISCKFQNNIYVKREDLHQVHSFKIRGSYLKIKTLVKEKGKSITIIAASAGNHAQGVALSAKHLGIKSIIVMPVNSPQIKVDAVTSYGSDIILYGDSFDEAKKYALKLSREKNLDLIHAFDDELIIAGQGTVGVELLQQLDDIDKIFVPIGGGGLIAGILSVIKSLRPEIKVIGVEAYESNSMSLSLKEDKVTILQQIGSFADGVAVKEVGQLCFNICKEYLDDTVLVSNDEICAAIKDLYDDTRSIAEPSGALSLAGVKKYIKEHNITNENLVSVISGANMNFHTIRLVSERAEIGEDREAFFAVKLVEKSGSFRKFLNDIKNRKINEFSYRYNGKVDAYVLVSIATNSEKDRFKLKDSLEKSGYEVYDLHDDELVKTHIRHMTNGMNFENRIEQAYEIIVSNRSSDLMNLLNILDDKYNISLFHYLYYDTEHSSVLCAFDTDDKNNLEELFRKNNIHFKDVSNNVSYNIFLKGNVKN